MPRPKLPNSPLVEVSCEVRFNGSLSILGSWGELHEQLRARFPRLIVPGAVPGTSSLLQHVRLTGDDSVVMLALNSFAYSTNRYEVFAKFRSEFLDLFGLFERHCRPGPYTRFGLRYTNSLPPSFPGGTPGQLHPCLTLQVHGWGGAPAFLGQPVFSFETQRNAVTLRTTLAAPEGGAKQIVMTAEGHKIALAAEPGIKLDLDAYVALDTATLAAAELVDRAHDVIDEAFFGMITDSYREYLGDGEA